MGVHPRDVHKVIYELQSEVGLELQSINITRHITEEPGDVRQILGITDEIEINRIEGDTFTALDTDSSAIIYWHDPSGRGTGHYTCLDDTPRFQGIENNRGNVGGQAGADICGENGLIPTMVFNIKNGNRVNEER